MYTDKPELNEIFMENIHAMMRAVELLLEDRDVSASSSQILSWKLTYHVLRHVKVSYIWYVDSSSHVVCCDYCHDDCVAMDVVNYGFTNVVMGLSLLGINYKEDMYSRNLNLKVPTLNSDVSVLTDDIEEYMSLVEFWAIESDKVKCGILRSIEYKL